MKHSLPSLSSAHQAWNEIMHELASSQVWTWHLKGWGMMGVMSSFSEGSDIELQKNPQRFQMSPTLGS